jgi:hypothetical protein
MTQSLMDLSKLGDEIGKRNRLWRPRHARMDYWLSMYLLYDAWQENKPLGQRRFISNDPQTIVDTCHRVISRFPLQWQIAIDQYSKTGTDEAKLYGDIERALYGFMEDVDEDLLDRGESVARKHAAYQGLLRGMITCKVHITVDTDRPSGIVYVPYDSRFVLPSYSGRTGMSSIICLTPMLVGEIGEDYPSMMENSWQPEQVVMKAEVWDKSKMAVAICAPNTMKPHKWLINPIEHKCFGVDGKIEEGKLNKLPFVVRDVNPLPIAEKPSNIYSNIASGQMVGIGRQNSDSIPGNMRKMLGGGAQEWRTTRRPVAERGRSILSSIEKHFPQFNEAVASIWQAHSNDAFGIYFMQTRGGVVPAGIEDALGSGGIVGIERGDSVQRFQGTPANQAGLQFMQVLSLEKEKGTISGVLSALGEYRSGFLQARMEQVALNALEPYIHGQASWGSGVGQLIIDQVKYADHYKGKLSLAYTKEQGAGAAANFFNVEFDPKVLKEINRPVVKAEIEPSLPVDMMERATIANVLVNGRRPLISRSTAQERVLRLPDSSRENDRIWEDIAETDPVVIMEELAQGLERLGKDELAKVFRDRESMMLAMEMLQQMQMQQMMGSLNNRDSNRLAGGQGQGQEEARNGPGVSPSEQSPEMRGEGREQAGNGGV